MAYCNIRTWSKRGLSSAPKTSPGWRGCLHLCVCVAVAASFWPSTASGHLFLQRVSGVEVLTHVLACANPGFECQRPLHIPVPSNRGECTPYNPLAASAKGSFVVAWSQSPSLPPGTTVAVCTALQLWSLSLCVGSVLTVAAPERLQATLEKAAARGGGGGVLRLGYSGPFPTHTVIRSLRCTNVTTWKIQGGLRESLHVTPSLAAGESLNVTPSLVPGESLHVTPSDAARESQHVSESSAASANTSNRHHGHRISLNLGLLLATIIAMGLFGLFGVAFAYAFGDSLSGLVVEEVEDFSALDPKSQAEESNHAKWFDPSCSDWDSIGTKPCRTWTQPSKFSWGDAVQMAVFRIFSSRWSSMFFRGAEPFYVKRDYNACEASALTLE